VIKTVTDYRPSDRSPTPAAEAGLDERLGRVRTVLERLRAGARPSDDGDVQTRLTHAANLLAEFDALRPDIESRVGAPRADGSGDVAARVAFDLYDGAVRDLRGVAEEARRGVERAEAVFAEALIFARRRRRLAERLAAKIASRSG
jgi:hypothetical protein